MIVLFIFIFSVGIIEFRFRFYFLILFLLKWNFSEFCGMIMVFVSLFSRVGLNVVFLFFLLMLVVVKNFLGISRLFCFFNLIKNGRLV